jgi:hypothetical protein
MSDDPLQDGTLPLEAVRRVDRLCLAFEDAWKAGTRPTINSFLEQAPDADRFVLLRELVLIDLSYLEQCGETPGPDDYQRQFPTLGGAIDSAFSTWRSGGKGPPPPHSDERKEQVPPERPWPVVGERLGRYVVQRELGRGSYGSVYLAEDEELRRPVAVKVPRLGRLANDEVVERFLEEARTVAQLKHPPIVPVYDVGRCEDGTPYVVMEYIEGCSLQQRLADARLEPTGAAELIAAIADAVDYAHSRGFVHRDLKPANILLDNAGGPHVADFGLALHESVQRGRAGELAGTIHYMAPEQVRRESHRLDGRTDIWALGVMLYEMLTGRRPFDGEDGQQVADEILHREPRPLRQIDAKIPEAIERICLRCLSKPIAERYATARDLAKDLKTAIENAAAGLLPGGSRSRRISASLSFGKLGCSVVVALSLMIGLALFYFVGPGSREVSYFRAAPALQADRMLPDVAFKPYKLDVEKQERMKRARSTLSGPPVAAKPLQPPAPFEAYSPGRPSVVPQEEPKGPYPSVQSAPPSYHDAIGVQPVPKAAACRIRRSDHATAASPGPPSYASRHYSRIHTRSAPNGALSGIWRASPGTEFRIDDDGQAAAVELRSGDVLTVFSGKLNRRGEGSDDRSYAGILQASFRLDASQRYSIKVTATLESPGKLLVRCDDWPVWNAQGTRVGTKTLSEIWTRQ